MKTKRNRRKKITREMIMNKFRFPSVWGTYIYSQCKGITYDQM